MPSYQIVEVRTLHLWARLVTGLKRTPTLLPRSLQGTLIVYNFHQVLRAGGKTTHPYQFVRPYQIVSTVKGLYSLKSYQIVHPSQLPGTSGILEFQNLGILEPWNSGILEFRNSEIPEFGNFRILESCNSGISEFWNSEVPEFWEFWNSGILKFQNL